MRNQVITIEHWWETAEKSGKAVFETLEELSKQTGLSEVELRKCFSQKVTALSEWWDAIGKYFYKTHAVFARELTSLLPPPLTYPRRTLSNQIYDGKMPAYVEYRKVLFAVTALPIFSPRETVSIPTLAELDTEKWIEGLERVIDLQGEAILQVLQAVSAMNLTVAQRQRLDRALARITEQIEDWEITQKMNEVFS